MAAKFSVSDKYSFVLEPEEEVRCLICLEVALDPLQHGKCRKVFCKDCIAGYGEDKPYPNCRMTQPLYFEDHSCEFCGLREIFSREEA